MGFLRTPAPAAEALQDFRKMFLREGIPADRALANPHHTESGRDFLVRGLRDLYFGLRIFHGGKKQAASFLLPVNPAAHHRTLTGDGAPPSFFRATFPTSRAG